MSTEWFGTGSWRKGQAEGRTVEDWSTSFTSSFVAMLWNRTMGRLWAC